MAPDGAETARRSVRRRPVSAVRSPELVFEFVAQYGIEVLARLPQRKARHHTYPSLAAFTKDAPPLVLRVTPAHVDPWIGAFHGDYNVPAVLRPHVIGWPDEVSVCVVCDGDRDRRAKR